MINGYELEGYERVYVISGRSFVTGNVWTLTFRSPNREEAYKYCEELNKNIDTAKFVVESMVIKKRDGR